MLTVMAEETEARFIRVGGAVQGVGFRPFVHRLARQCRLCGSVRNSSVGVTIEIEGLRSNLDEFQKRLREESPFAALIEEVTTQPISVRGRTSFVIDASDSLGQPLVRLPRDLATCPECYRDVFENENRRHSYPFTNCTACGPRYSIIEAMPYDRPATAMRLFQMCSACRSEYQSVDNRRFHAEPNACHACGPQVRLWDREGRTIAGPDQAIAVAAQLLQQGRIVALKGLGGFQLLVPADDANAVQCLRQRKHRPSKPFAVMVSSLQAAEDLAELSDVERRVLHSPQNPIVLACRRRGSVAMHKVAEQVAPNVGTLGLFLPTTPLHHLLMAKLRGPLIATSGNRSDEPIVTDERAALRQLASIADVLLVHDRPVVRRVDDSVVRVICGHPVTFRLARGYAPLPLPALEDFAAAAPPVLATGGHQKGAVALWSGSQAVLSQHIGDLDHHDTRTTFTEVTLDLSKLYEFDPEVIACDMHPDYFTTRWASAKQRQVVRVQHHHAHAVSCMVDNGLLDREVLAIVWDGTGYGTDGLIWGGEILRASCSEFRRVASLLPFPLPGGAAAIRHPNRTAFGLLYLALGPDALLQSHDLLRRLSLTPRDAAALATMIRSGINTPCTSSIGRLFDAVAVLILGILEASYEGEPAVVLEACADTNVTESYPMPLRPAAACGHVVGDLSIPRGDWRPMLSALLDDLTRDVEPGVIAARFHQSLAVWAKAVVREQSLSDVVLSGGCFQNRLLTERTEEALRGAGYRVHLHRGIPPGDGGLAVGQLAVAIAQMQRSSHPSQR